MKMTLHLLKENPNEAPLWIFLNDFFCTPSNNYDYSMASELTNSSLMILSNMLHQHINCILTDDLESSLSVAQTLGFKKAISLRPGVILKQEFIDTLLQDTKNIEFFGDSEDDTWGAVHIFDCKSPFLKRKGSGQRLKQLTPLAASPAQPEKIVNVKSVESIFNEPHQEHPDTHSQNLQKRNLAWAEHSRKIYLYNNEPITENEISKFLNEKIDRFVVPSSGFYVNDLYSMLNTTAKSISYFDSNLASLELKKYINDSHLSPLEIQKFSNYDSISQQKKVDHPSLINTERLSLFYKIKKEYYHLNLISHFELIADICAEVQQSWLWISNIYTFNVSIYNHGPSELIESYQSLMLLLKKRAPATIIHGKDPWGKYFLERASNVKIDGFGHAPSWFKYYSQARNREQIPDKNRLNFAP